MIVRPAMAGLRSRPAPQPLVDAALAAWRASPEVAALRGELAAWDRGEALAALPALARLAADHAAGMALAESFTGPLLDALRAEPLAQLPLGHSAAPGIARIRLAGSGGASLALAVFAPRALREPRSVLFEDGEAHEMILAGTGTALCHRIGLEGLTRATIRCAPGTRLVRRGTNEARQIVEVTRPLLMLQLLREAPTPAPSREIALSDGALLKTISGCKQTSQRMMALGVLGALEHRPALGAMAQLASASGAERDLRWEALRQVLALDSAQGLALLAELAVRAEDALGPPAAQLRRDLIAAHPELGTLEPA